MNLSTFKLSHEILFKYTFEEEEGENLEQSVIDILALGLALDVPIYPNTKRVESQLVKYYKIILEKGFTAPGNDGKRVRLKATNSKSLSDFSINNINKIDFKKLWSAIDLLLLKENIETELQKLNNAQRTLGLLKVAISELQQALEIPMRNENELQRILTQNPILFGLEYSRIIPKHQLGSDYELDYALEQYSGIIDFVEIEASSHKLYTNAGNPSKDLVHAEQQAIDWINWVETNNSYARNKLKTLFAPKAFIIIGRSKDLTDKDVESLRRRNKIFNNALIILTFDDLLVKAQTVLRVLEK